MNWMKMNYVCVYIYNFMNKNKNIFFFFLIKSYIKCVYYKGIYEYI